MADNPTIDNGSLTDYTVSADEASSGQVQRVKLAYSADGTDTHVPADADGLLVNLGTNNDVTVSGTVTVQDGGNVISVDDGNSSITVDGTVTANLAAGSVVIIEGTDTLASGRVNVTTTSGEAVAARATRHRLTLWALPSNTADIDIGPSGVASGSGFPLPPGYSATLVTSAAVHADAASGTQVLAYWEEYE